MHEEYIRTVPKSKTAVLFIHGIFGTPNHFSFLTEKISDEYSVYNILLDGHGKSAEDIAKTSMKKWKTQVSNIMNKLSIEFENIMIVAHSMGTLFAIEESIKHSDKVKCLFLLASPLKVFLKPLSVTTTLRLVFKIADKTDFMLNAKAVHGVEHTKKLWVYAGWIPRYLELFKEIKETRKKITSISVPCYVYQSAKDEMVSKKSINYIKVNPDINIKILENSYHFFYNKDDKEYLEREFIKLLNMI